MCKACHDDLVRQTNKAYSTVPVTASYGYSTFSLGFIQQVLHPSLMLCLCREDKGKSDAAILNSGCLHLVPQRLGLILKTFLTYIYCHGVQNYTQSHKPPFEVETQEIQTKCIKQLEVCFGNMN